MAIISGGNGVRAQGAAKPIIINGDMAIAQRSTSVTGITSDGYQTCDRIRPSFTGDGIGTYTFIQESLTSGNAFANGFTKAFRLDCTTADSSPASGDYFYLAYKIEGNNLQAFKKGTTNAQKMTLAFWVKSNKTGTAQVNMNDQDNTRMCSGTYAISSADTWEHKVINIAADTTGAFGNDANNSMQIEWWLDGGSNFQGGAVPTAWEARSNNDRGVSDLAIADNTANDFAITGIQLEVGEYSSTTLPPFQHETFHENFLRCSRYYQRSYDYGTAYLANDGQGVMQYVEGVDNGHFYHEWRHGPMRTGPTMTIQRKNGGGANQGQRIDYGSTYLDIDEITGDINGVMFLQNGTQSGQGYTFASHYLADAEL